MRLPLIAIMIIAVISLSVQAELIHRWEFEGNSTDSVGSVSGTVNGGAVYTAGKIGQAISLDGIDDYISSSSGVSIPATDYTITAWVYWDSVHSDRGYIAGGQYLGGRGEVFTLSRKTAAQGGTDRKLFLNLLPNGAGTITQSADDTISTDEWMHVAYTLSSSNGVTLYLNGDVVAANATRTTHVPNTNFNIGATTQAGTPENFFAGMIDDLRIYEKALSSAEISDVMEAYKNPSVDAGSDWVTWSSQPFTLDDVVVTNNDPDAGDLSLEWSVVSIAGVKVDISQDNIVNPTIVAVKDASAANPLTVKLILTVTQSGKEPEKSSMEIDIFDNVCDASKAVGDVSLDSTDYNYDCVTDLKDFAMLAAMWFVNYQLDGPQPK